MILKDKIKRSQVQYFSDNNHSVTYLHVNYDSKLLHTFNDDVRSKHFQCKVRLV